MHRKVLVSVIIVTKDRKKDLVICLKSVLSSTYTLIEVIVIDNGSKRKIYKSIKSLYPQVIVLRVDKNIGAAAGRNLGIEFSKGEYLLFIDDDAMVDTNMINELIVMFNKYQNVGVVQPKIYDMKDKNVLQGIGCNINLLTGRVSALGIREKDYGQYDSIREISSVGCIWMVKRELVKKVGGYDIEYFIPYEDLDFSFRIRKLGFKIYFVPKALAWHKGIKSTFINPLVDYIGIRNKDRAFRISRNKVIFMRKHAPFVNFLFFIVILLPTYCFIHSSIILLSWRVDLLIDYWRGTISGLWFAILYNNKRYNPYYGF